MQLSILDYIDLNSKLPFNYENLIHKFNHKSKHLICDKIVGNFLATITQLINPKNVLEIGTMIGYSSICIANKMQEGSCLETIELRQDDANKAKENFIFFNVENKTKIYIGDALNIIPKINKPWDMVFIDADKINYLNYYKLVIPFVKKNGIIIFDNMLFHEQVINKTIYNKNVKAIRETNEYLKNDNQINNTLLNIRDGIQFVIKN